MVNSGTTFPMFEIISQFFALEVELVQIEELGA